MNTQNPQIYMVAWLAIIQYIKMTIFPIHMFRVVFFVKMPYLNKVFLSI